MVLIDSITLVTRIHCVLLHQGMQAESNRNNVEFFFNLSSSHVEHITVKCAVVRQDNIIGFGEKNKSALKMKKPSRLILGHNPIQYVMVLSLQYACL